MPIGPPPPPPPPGEPIRDQRRPSADATGASSRGQGRPRRLGDRRADEHRLGHLAEALAVEVVVAGGEVDRRRGRRTGRGRPGSTSSSSSWRALGHHPSGVEHDDAVGQAQRRAAVGDEDRRAVGHQLPQGVVDGLLGRRVDRRGGVVEHQDARVGEDGPGQGDALALAAREGDAPLADDGVVALGQRGRRSVVHPPPRRPPRPRRRWRRAGRRRCWPARCRRRGRRPRRPGRPGGAATRG